MVRIVLLGVKLYIDVQIFLKDFCIPFLDLYPGHLLPLESEELLMMRRLFRTKSRVILFLAGTTACLYVLLLYYSMNRLDAVHSRSVHLHKLDSDIGRMVRRAEEEEEEALSRDKVSQQTPQTKMVRGVLYRRLHLYQPTVNDTFQCLYSKVREKFTLYCVSFAGKYLFE